MGTYIKCNECNEYGIELIGDNELQCECHANDFLDEPLEDEKGDE